MAPTPFKKPSDIKPMCLFTKKLDMKKKTAIHLVRAARSKRKANKSVTTPWAMKEKKGY